MPLGWPHRPGVAGELSATVPVDPSIPLGNSHARHPKVASGPLSGGAARAEGQQPEGRNLRVAVVTMKQLLEAGVHFGHQTRRWNPKMQRFIFGERNGIYIIDLQQTLERIDTAYRFVRSTVADGGTVMFVGTKKQAQEPVQSQALRSGMPYVNFRWLGGMLTNFQTVHARVAKLRELERLVATGEVDQMIKKEGLKVKRELVKLERNLGGIRNLEKLPSIVFVIDTKKEHIAVTEANRLGIPVVAVVDTNCDPDIIDYVIPGNDDAIRASNLMCRVIADAVEEGRHLAQKRGARPGTKAEVVAPKALSPEEQRKRAEEQAAARTPARRPPRAGGSPRPRRRRRAASEPSPRSRRRSSRRGSRTRRSTRRRPAPKCRRATVADVTAKDVAALRKVTGAGMMDCKKALIESDGDQEAAVDWLRKQGLGASKRAGRSAEQGTVDVVLEDDVAALVELTCETDFVAKGADFVATVAALARLVAEKGDEGLARPAVRGPDRRRGRHAARRQARREDRARPGRPLRDHRRPAGRLQAHPERARAPSASWSSSAASTASDPKAKELAHDLALHIASAAPRFVRREDVSADAIEKEREVLTELTRNEGKPEAAIGKIVEGRLNGFYKDYVPARAGLRARPEGHGRLADRGPRRRSRGPTVHPRQGGRGIGSVWTRTRECR